MLEDEIAFALTQATPITQNILSKVIFKIYVILFRRTRDGKINETMKDIQDEKVIFFLSHSGRSTH
jgi:hypothetical protein